MTDERAYRVIIRFEPGNESFTAQVPELGISETKKSRAEAVAAAEQAIDSAFQTAAAGEALPAPIDSAPVPAEISVKVSDSLYRELLFVARRDGMSVEALATELLARAAGRLEPGARPPRRREPEPRAEAAPAPDGDEQPRMEERASDRPRGDRGDRGDRGGDRGDRRGPRREREGYRPELDDKANFLEYLRNLEKGGGPPRGNRGRR
jgi:hypothetical protein